MALYDKHGVPIQPYDLVKLFHFNGARRKRYYMYKWIVPRSGKLRICHLDKEPICDSVNLDQKLIDSWDTEIVQGYTGGPFEDRERKPREEAP